MPVDSSSLLHSAVLESNEKAVRFLLKHGADPNARSHHHHHHHHHRSNDALQNLSNSYDAQSVDMCEIFTRYRSSSFSTFTPNPVALAPNLPYTLSARNRSHQSLVESHHYHHRQQKPLTPMHIAAANGYTDIVELLICYGGDIDAEMEGDYTPMMIAVLYQHYDIVEMLANKGANVNARSRGGKTPMYFAVKTKLPEMVWLLLKNGADPNVATYHGVTPLHIAVERKLPEIVEILLKNGAEVNVTTKTGVTPLHCAAAKGQTDIMEMILSCGGDVSAIMKKDEIDVTPLLWVTETERKRISDVVRKYAPKTKSAGVYGTFFKKIWKHFGLKKY